MQDFIKSLKFFSDKDIVLAEEITTRYEGNHLIRVETDRGVFAVRRMIRGESEPTGEYKILDIAANNRIAPKIYSYDPKTSVIVMEWIAGEHRVRLDAEELIALVEVMKTLHSIDIEDQKIQTIDLKKALKTDEVILEAFDILENYPLQKALCHNDPNPHNIIWRNKIPKLVDFEYGGINDVYFDLAATSIEFGLSQVGDRVLLDEYWGENDHAPGKFHAYKVIYTELCSQWLESRDV
jgi:thiamine kinase-like enzyme